MTTDQVAAYIGKSRNTVDRLQRDGKITPLPRATSRATRYFLKSDIDAFVAERNRTNPLKRPIVVRAIPTRNFVGVPDTFVAYDGSMTTLWQELADRAIALRDSNAEFLGRVAK
jgi:predicted DNA-binding transcriptional regulator AlpA